MIVSVLKHGVVTPDVSPDIMSYSGLESLTKNHTSEKEGNEGLYPWNHRGKSGRF